MCHFSHRLYEYEKWTTEATCITNPTGTVRAEGHWHKNNSGGFLEEVIGSPWTLTYRPMCCFLMPLQGDHLLRLVLKSVNCLATIARRPHPKDWTTQKRHSWQKSNTMKQQMDTHTFYHFNQATIYTTLTKSDVWMFSQVSFKWFRIKLSCRPTSFLVCSVNFSFPLCHQPCYLPTCWVRRSKVINPEHSAYLLHCTSSTQNMHGTNQNTFWYQIISPIFK